MKKKCTICNNEDFKIVWNNKIRSGKNKFTKKKEVILKCRSCELVFLKNLRKNLENSAVTRSLYNQDSSIAEFMRFHKPRELKKLMIIKKFLNYKNKTVLESNCGAGVLLTILKSKARTTAGIDDKSYKDFLEKNNHNYFSSINNVIKKNKKFDIIFSLSELEHKFDPVKFLKQAKKILSAKGRIILRIPNYKNIYSMLLDNDFYKYDFRTSHNYYFSENNIELLLKKVGFSTEKKVGIQEYDFNHLLAYIKKRKRITGRYPKIFRENINLRVKENIEKSFVSTSLIYIIKHS
jgi:2-polyprenyl-3-methyl-5-hydroxy-6-metoxy-1,4-benzoquinol methylase